MDTIITHAPQNAADPQTTVREFLSRLEGGDVAGACELLSEDVVYINVPAPPIKGRDKTRKFLSVLGGRSMGFEARLINITAQGNTVLTERLDVITGPSYRLEIPLMGAFILRDGKIAEWRDYFDWTTTSLSFLKQAPTLMANTDPKTVLKTVWALVRGG